MPRLLNVNHKHGFTRARHRWSNSTYSATNCFPIQHIRQIYSHPLRLFQTWRNDSEERDSSSESSSSPKQRLILKSWTNHIIRTTWKSWRIVGSSVSSWKETIRNKNESIKKNMFYYVFLKTYWLAFVYLRNQHSGSQWSNRRYCISASYSRFLNSLTYMRTLLSSFSSTPITTIILGVQKSSELFFVKFNLYRM